jgi:hypothetical protein
MKTLITGAALVLFPPLIPIFVGYLLFRYFVHGAIVLCESPEKIR